MPSETIATYVAHAAHYLPAQGPITAFVHHNTLHAFENLPFDQALEQAAVLYGCEPYLSKERYRTELERGRIRPVDLEAVLQDELGSTADELIAGLVQRRDLCLSMLLDPLPVASEAEIHWLIVAGDGLYGFQQRSTPWLRRQLVAETRQWVMRELRSGSQTQSHLHALATDVLAHWDESRIESWSPAVWEEVSLTLLWRICRHGSHTLPQPSVQAPLRLRDRLASQGQDPDLLVHELLIRFCASFTDQGLANWSLPAREEGFFKAFTTLFGQGYPIREPWLRQLPQELERVRELSPTQIINESLAAFNIPEERQQEFITATLLALRGWAGMLWQLESRPDRVHQAVPPGTLLEFLAIRLLLDRLAAAYLVQEQALGHSHQQDKTATSTQAAYSVFLLAQAHGWSPQRLAALSRPQWQALFEAIEGFGPFRRRRLFQAAYERRYRHQVFDALLAHRPAKPLSGRPALQMLCCLDEREESFRRHLEELAPAAESFGLAGFFGVAMYYLGAEEAHEMPLCPVSIRPQHRVVETVRPEDQERFARAMLWKRRFGLAAYGLQTGSHGFVRGLLTTLAGALATVPLVARVLLPRLTARLNRQAAGLVQAPFHTVLALERPSGVEPNTEPHTTDVYSGFSLSEMAAIVANQLQNIGLTQNFARLVLVFGHGSSSLNNPQEAAHDCGACGGGRGGPNARAFAAMANHPEVRQLLAASGLVIPDDTYFLGAYHNTCDDSLLYYDLNQVPTTHQSDLKQAQTLSEAACERNAHERARRFRSAGLLISPAEARHHVEARAEDLAQPRPEYGHATNANCIIARRQRTRGLFMDRRSFLVSYDPKSEAGDPTAPILTRILKAAVPVCAGINLEYYFSYVDNTGWGCGTKLPHNITSLLGVMEGAASDLRPGLPWQMVEIHEPVRLNIVVETQAECLAGILAREPELARLCCNGWVALATLDPDTAAIQVYTEGEFKPYQPESHDLPLVDSSASWYAGLREHLGFASIQTEVQP